jgi:CRISPR system Cascade subunit CasB
MSKPLKQHQQAFLHYLLSLNHDSHRQTLAALRRGLTAPPGETPEMYRYLARFVPEEERGTGREQPYYLLAALYAFHPANTEQGNFGTHMAQAAAEADSLPATERRFTLLLNADRRDLPDLLRQSVSYLKSKEAPVNWRQLFKDLLYWDHPNHMVERQWANGFWAFQPVDPETEQDNI